MSDTSAAPVAQASGDAQGSRTGAMPRWGMVIDLNRCVGCQTCTIACKHANDTPPGVQWRKVIDVEQGSYPDVERVFLVTGCQHCAEPPCVPVCPTGATRQREDGLVTMNYDVCIGCAYCAVSCPYQARTIVHEAQGYYGVETRQERATAHPERLGVAQKCSFCIERVDEAKATGRRPGVDLDVTPACSASCIAQAIQFGDFRDPGSNVSRLAGAQPSFQMHAELGTDPQIRYLYTTPAVPGRDAAAADNDDDRASDPANPLAGGLQTFWDWRAAMNWCFGGASSGLALLAWLTGAQAPWLQPLAAVLMATGLFFVFLKIGRKLRFWRAVSRPQTSWMTRELYAVMVFYPAVLAGPVWPGPLPIAIAGLAAGAFLLCQAMILVRARGIPAWRVPLMPWMIFATGLLEGYGLLVLVASAPAWLGLALIAANAALWTRYRRGARAAGIGPRARAVIDASSRPLYIVGHALPALLLVVGLPALAGIALLAGGTWWKFAVIVRAGYQQGFALPKMPQRGSGSRAAPTRTAGYASSPAPN